MYFRADRLIIVSIFIDILRNNCNLLGEDPRCFLYNIETIYEPSKEEVEKRFDYKMD